MFFEDGTLTISVSKDVGSQLAIFHINMGSQRGAKLKQSTRYNAPRSDKMFSLIKFKFILHLGRVE